MGSMRRCATALAVVVLVAAGLSGPPPAAAGPAEEMEAAQRRANSAAGELAGAVETLAKAEDTVTHLQTRVERVEARVGVVRDQLRQLAVRQYVEGTAGITRLLRMADANQIVRTQQFAWVIAGTSGDALERYRADRADLREELSDLEREQEDREVAIGDLRRRQSDAVRELDRLARLEEQAREAEQRRVAAAAAVAAATAAPAPSASGGPSPTPAGPSGTTAPPAARAPAPAAPVGGPAGGWVCPVQGPRSFSNDYGAARSGGKSHQGNDILSPRGTPVVANVGGVVTQRDGAVSGLAYFLAGDDGNRYFGAHLDSFGASGRVGAGTVIGTVGNTGDAAGGPPHLHFEIHPGGSGYTNPYSTLTRYC